MKIAVYTMAKNEATHVERFVKTTEGADCVVVTDTGSTDGTPDLLRDHGIVVQTARIIPWRFDTATNVALAHVPDDIDVCVKLDLDEVLFTQSGRHWRDEIEKLAKENVCQYMYWYTWKWHVSGKVPAVRFRTGNIHRRAGFIWRHPGHAALCQYGKPGEIVQCQDLEVHHYMVSKSRPNYMSVLEQAVRECPCPRTLFYLGREHFFGESNKDASALFEKYLNHPDSRWKAERAEAMRMLGVIYGRTRAPNQALAWLSRAAAEYPGTREIWFELTRHFTSIGDMDGAYWAGKKTLRVVDRDPEFTTNSGDAWSSIPFLITAKAAMAVGRPEEAKNMINGALKIDPANKQALDLMQEVTA